jgi:ribosomal protein S18 acetylase RimI-like enzyme
MVPLILDHCPEVARLHLESLRTRFRGRPGLKLLEAYYAALVSSGGACGYVAEGGDQVLGFVCGVWQPSLVRVTLLKTHWSTLLVWGAVQVLVRPQLIQEFARRLRGPAQHPLLPESGYELRPIVVAATARRGGIGKQLVEALLVDAARRGFDRVYLVTEEDNVAANAFYHKLGFHLGGRTEGPDVVYFHYEYSLQRL